MSPDTPPPQSPRKRAARKTIAKATAAPAMQGDALAADLLAVHTIHATARVPEPPCETPSVVPLVLPVVPTASTFAAWASRPGNAAMAELCEFIVGQGTGGHLAGFARGRGFAYMALLDWIQADPARAALYDRAREERADILADEVTEIADAPADTAVEVARSRLRVEARKWAAARLKPRVYGERAAGQAGGQAGDVPQAPPLHDMSDEALLAIAQGAAGRTGKGRNA